MTTLPGVIAAPDWQPGDDLYERHAYSQYLYNFRDDPTSDDCRCGDAASWPVEPLVNRRITDDPFADFIAWWRAVGESGAVSDAAVAWAVCAFGVVFVLAVAVVGR